MRKKSLKKVINKIVPGDAFTVLRSLPDESVDCCVTSPPYWKLRDYGVSGQIGLETSLQEYIERILCVFSQVYRVLKKNGTLWLNIGDSYAKKGYYGGNASGFGSRHSSCINRSIPAGIKRKELIGLPWRIAFALQESGWYLRSDIIWSKPNPLPESVKDRPTKAHEYLFLLSKSTKYYYDYEAVQEPIAYASAVRLNQNITKQKGSGRVQGKTNGMMKAVYYKGNRKVFRGCGKYTDNSSFDNSNNKTDQVKGNEKSYIGGMTKHFAGHSGYYDKNGKRIGGVKRNKRTVWTVSTQGFKKAHFATFPEKLIIPCIQAGCPVEGIVLDPFMGAGTSELVARKLNRNFIGIELNPVYIQIALNRLKEKIPLFI